MLNLLILKFLIVPDSSPIKQLLSSRVFLSSSFSVTGVLISYPFPSNVPENLYELDVLDDNTVIVKIEETLNTYTHLYKNALTDITSLIDDMNEELGNS